MAHGLETILQAAERLRGRDDIVFLLVGAGAKREQLSQLTEGLRLSSVRFLEKQPRERIPTFLAAADACLVPLRNQEVFKSALPSKMFEAMAAGKPVILGVDGESKEILLASQAGLAIRPEDPEAMVEAILRLRNDPSLRHALGRNGRQAVLEKFLRSTQACEYLNLLSQLCVRGKFVAAAAPVALPE
jgi:glycosyltransferase involved in cell wall biosynthesis